MKKAGDEETARSGMSEHVGKFIIHVHSETRVRV